MKAVILAGGLGTRLAEETAVRPKPMVEIGGKPVLWHILKIYSHHGINDFVICLGYQRLRDQGVLRQLLPAHVGRHLRPGATTAMEVLHRHVRALARDAGRHRRATRRPAGASSACATTSTTSDFCFTYGDGLADVDIGALIAFHRAAGRAGHASPPCSRPGASARCDLDGDAHHRASRKSRRATAAGSTAASSCSSPRCCDCIEGDRTVWEREPLEQLARDGQLCGLRHRGFWQPMDTLRDKIKLEELWAAGTRAVEGVAGAMTIEPALRRRLRGRRVLVTGHTGFKGSWLALWLQQLGARVSGLALPADAQPNHSRLLGLQFDEALIDLRDACMVRAALRRFEPEMVFHLAAQPLVRRSYREPAATFDTNVMGLVNLLEAVRATPSVRVVVNATTDKCLS